MRRTDHVIIIPNRTSSSACLAGAPCRDRSDTDVPSLLEEQLGSAYGFGCCFLAPRLIRAHKRFSEPQADSQP